jgi:uncharacterized membrane protein
MNDECTVSVYDDVEQAHRAVHILELGDFPITHTSIVTKGLRERPQEVEELEMGGDDSARDAAIGAGLGGILGVFGGVELGVVMGIGAVFFFGPIGLGMMGSVVGAFLGGMAGWGVHEKRIRHYEELIKHRKTLIIATGNPQQLIQADRILKETGPLEHHLYSKTSSEAPEVNTDKNLPKKLPTVHASSSKSELVGDISNAVEAATTPGERATSLDIARDRFSKAIGILANEKGTIKERLWIAYASQLSQLDKQLLPDEVRDDFWHLRNALSDADMPYGSGERAKVKINALTDDEASSFAGMIDSMFLRLSAICSKQAAN